jgi:ribosomal protein S18 acetylase RimI-like enzyme
LEGIAFQNGRKKIILHAREIAIGFYQKLGYETIEKSHLLFGEIQHYLMEKTL